MGCVIPVLNDSVNDGIGSGSGSLLQLVSSFAVQPQRNVEQTRTMMIQVSWVFMG